MHELFIFDAVVEKQSARSKNQRVTVVFCPTPAVNDRLIKAELTEHFDTSLPTDEVMLLGTKACADVFQALIQSETVLDSLPHYTRWANPPALSASWCDNKGHHEHAGSMNAPLINAIITGHLAQQGLLHLFATRCCLLRSGAAFHYQKPSGRHSESFIRTANVLVHGSEIAFIAYCLLPYVSHDVAFIYTDTAAINALAYALVQLKQQVDRTFKQPTISSFGSYVGIGNFRFKEPCFTIVSASTTGGLEAQLIKEKFLSRNQISTVFFLGQGSPEAPVICDLTKQGYTPIKNLLPETCTLCKQRVPVISITGEQFLPENPYVRPELLTVSHAPSWLRDFMEDVAGKRLIRCNAPPARPDEPPRELFVALKSMIDGSVRTVEFERRLDRLILQSIPASLARIIHLDDPASLALAERVRARAAEFVPEHRNVPLIPARDLYVRTTELYSDHGAALVVASAIVSGRSVLGVSQMLRRVQTNGAIQYLIALGKTRSHQRYEEIRNNLQHGGYDFHIVNNLFLPSDSLLRATAWQQELALLKELTYRYRTQPLLIEAVQARRDFLDEEASGGGAIDELFWRTPTSNDRLSIGPRFAFWNSDYPAEHATQADVYFTIAAVLHYAREGHGDASAWLQHEHQRVILSPYNFARFNDGVIQASLLRAAHAAEIDYTVDETASATMRGILEGILDNLDTPTGDAAVEVLLAIALERLRLQRPHCDLVMQRLQNRTLPPSVAVLVKYINEKVLPNTERGRSVDSRRSKKGRT